MAPTRQFLNLRDKLNGDIIMAIASLILVAVYFGEILKMSFSVGGMGFFPLVLAVIMFAAWPIILVRSTKKKGVILSWRFIKIPIILVSLTGIFIGAFLTFGYFVSTLLFSFGVALAFQGVRRGKVRTLVPPAIIAIIITLVGFLLFEVVFDIRLPMGVI